MMGQIVFSKEKNWKKLSAIGFTSRQKQVDKAYKSEMELCLHIFKNQLC